MAKIANFPRLLHGKIEKIVFFCTLFWALFWTTFRVRRAGLNIFWAAEKSAKKHVFLLFSKHENWCFFNHLCPLFFFQKNTNQKSAKIDKKNEIFAFFCEKRQKIDFSGFQKITFFEKKSYTVIPIHFKTEKRNVRLRPFYFFLKIKKKVTKNAKKSYIFWNLRPQTRRGKKRPFSTIF